MLILAKEMETPEETAAMKSCFNIRPGAHC